MSHVNEGALHAYLDGALDELPPAEAERIRTHLDTCTECALRLEVERGVRSEAHAILGLAAPDVEIPSLEELRAYVERTRPRRPATGRLHRLGWAASVVIAVGAGWMLRDGQLQQRQIMQRGNVDPTVDIRAPALERPEATVALPTTVAAEVGSAEQVEVGSAEQMEGAAADVVLADRDRAANAVRDALAPAVEAPADAVATVTEEIDEIEWMAMPVTPSGAQSLRALGEPSPAISTPSVEATVSRTGADVAPGAFADDEAERRRAESRVAVTSAMARSGSGAYRPAAEDERARAGEPTLAVPGHEVLSVTNLGEGTTPYGVYVIQRLDGNTLLEIFHLDPGVDPSVLPTIGDDANEVRLEMEDGWVVIRSALVEDELEALLARLLPR